MPTINGTLGQTVNSVAAMQAVISGFMAASGFTVATAGQLDVYSAGGLHASFDYSNASFIDIRHGIGSAGAVLNNDSGYEKRANFFGISVTSATLFGFSNNDADPNKRYAHFECEFNNDGRFIRFGVDNLEKFNDWTGGALVYGGDWPSNNSAQDWQGKDVRSLADSNHLEQITSGATGNLATMRATGLPDQPAASKFLIFTGQSNAAVPPADGDGDPVARAVGMSRHGREPNKYIHARGNPIDANFLPINLNVDYRNFADATVLHPMGRMQDVGPCNIGNIVPKDTRLQGADTLQYFPTGQKILFAVGANQTEMQSANGGVWHRIIP